MSSLFGGSKSPQVDYAPTEIKDSKKKLKKLRTGLFKTEGGSAGEEVGVGGVKKTDTIFGN